jgi:hypothetical protein
MKAQIIKRAGICLLLCYTINLSKMKAQTIFSSSPVGEYYLRGVMETACGFKLNEDSTFQFFFLTVP